MEPVKKFRVLDPKNPTISEKMRILEVLLQQDLKAQDFKFTAFVAAARSEDINHALKPIPPGLTMQNGQLDIENLKHLIKTVPKFSELHQLLKKKQYNQLNSEIIDLVFWVMLYTQNIHEITVEDFMSNLPSTEVNRFDRRPTHVFRVFTSQEDSFNEFVIKHNITADTGYYCTSVKDIFKMLVYEFKKMDAEYLLLKTDLNSVFSLNERVWENSEFFTEFCCVAACNVPVQLNGKVEKFIAKNGDCNIRIYDKNLLLLKYLVLYEDDSMIVKVENPEQPWWKIKTPTLLLGVSAVLVVLITVRAAKCKLNG